ncbi:pelota family protein [Acidilobus sp.]|jgi:protein pelota|uniref:pelota family protein n=1 Tax=Acidilobus sp. TaxID=1872109 RepID=UPI003D079FE1
MEVRLLDSKARYIEVLPRSEEDLWTLAMTLRQGDLIRTVVTRDVSGRDAKSKERRPIEVLLRVENVEFQPFTGALRIFGVIEEGPDRFGVKGKHQSAYIGLNQWVTLIRDGGWSQRIIEKLRASGPRGKAIILAVDYESYAVAVLTPVGLRVLYENPLSLGSKDDPRREANLEEAIDRIANELVEQASKESANVVVVAGPTTVKDEVASKVRLLARGMRVVEDTVSSGGVEGIYEVMRRQSVLEALNEMNSVRAESILDEFMKLVSTSPDLVAYTLPEVKLAAELGAVKSLVIIDSLLYSIDDSERETAQNIVEVVESRGGEVVVITRESPASDTVASMGGVIAILRYKVPRELRETQRSP